jgi:hypothetical protein
MLAVPVFLYWAAQRGQGAWVLALLVVQGTSMAVAVVVS